MCLETDLKSMDFLTFCFPSCKESSMMSQANTNPLGDHRGIWDLECGIDCMTVDSCDTVDTFLNFEI